MDGNKIAQAIVLGLTPGIQTAKKYYERLHTQRWRHWLVCGWVGWLVMLCYPNLAVHGLGRNGIVLDQNCTETCAFGVVLKWSERPISCLLNVNHVNILMYLITVISQGQL